MASESADSAKAPDGSCTNAPSSTPISAHRYGPGSSVQGGSDHLDPFLQQGRISSSIEASAPRCRISYNRRQQVPNAWEMADIEAVMEAALCEDIDGEIELLRIMLSATLSMSVSATHSANDKLEREVAYLERMFELEHGRWRAKDVEEGDRGDVGFIPGGAIALGPIQRNKGKGESLVPLLSTGPKNNTLSVHVTEQEGCDGKQTALEESGNINQNGTDPRSEDIRPGTQVQHFSLPNAPTVAKPLSPTSIPPRIPVSGPSPALAPRLASAFVSARNTVVSTWGILLVYTIALFDMIVSLTTAHRTRRAEGEHDRLVWVKRTVHKKTLDDIRYNEDVSMEKTMDRFCRSVGHARIVREMTEIGEMPGEYVKKIIADRVCEVCGEKVTTKQIDEALMLRKENEKRRIEKQRKSKRGLAKGLVVGIDELLGDEEDGDEPGFSREAVARKGGLSRVRWGHLFDEDEAPEFVSEIKEEFKRLDKQRRDDDEVRNREEESASGVGRIVRFGYQETRQSRRRSRLSGR
ncbi:hypothetical protein MKZ38_000779 [Zalerion maritima]|uniref:Uncharacterized protein n=1 Tax=Zalerion maritima TaxID=339359 RepID=A0AAD5WN13_9PEZI|nr:hypothetical protein MKZ38_000779 [Zalerion maritima]